MLRKISVLAACGLVSACASFVEPETLSGRQKIVDWDSINQYAPATPPSLTSVPSDDPQCRATYQALAADYAGANRPELMAIGDSLYNGVQSLRINWYLSEWSAPSIVAMRLGLISEFRSDRTGERTFYGPQYPSYGQPVAKTVNYGLNLEGLPDGPFLHRVVRLAGTPAYQAAALEHLMDRYSPPNGRLMVDNLAFSGASSIDIDSWTAGDHRAAAHRLIARMRRKPLDIAPLGGAFTSANAAFVLNPTHNRCLDGWTPLDQVLFRQPVRLIINIGANNGIFAVAFSAATIEKETCDKLDEPNGRGVRRCDGLIRNFLRKRLLDDMKSAGGKLAEAKGIREVYINGVARPSRPANVLFNGTGDKVSYTTDLFVPTPIAQAELKRADTLADDTNAALRSLVEELNRRTGSGRNGPRFTFVDVDAEFDKVDYKGCLAAGGPTCEAKRLLIAASRLNDGPDARDISLDNRPYDYGNVPDGRHYPVVNAGGLFSMDNMHLSAVGYEVMAHAVLLQMLANQDPRMLDGGDRCRGRNDEGYEQLKVGDCRKDLTWPGHALVDITRRKQVGLRTLRAQDARRLRKLQELVKMMQ